jgi:hypothetical protein
VPERCRGLWRLARAALPLAVLTACPQLLKDDFYAMSVDDPSRSGDPVLLANVDAGDAGDNGGSGGGPKPPPPKPPPPPPHAEADAALPDTPPLSPVQVALHAALAHRYRFDSDALDSVGGADGVSVGATFSGGAAVLSGDGTGPYIDLPNGLLSGLHNASFEVWVIWDVPDPNVTTASWQRIYDLGRNPTTVEGQQCQLDANATALYLTPRISGSSPSTLQLKCETCGETRIEAPSLPVGVQVQLVAVVDDDANLLSLYRDGVLVGAPQPYPGSISQITTCTGRPAPCDWNNWLGRSQHSEDPPFQGRILDFRIYATALGATQVKASFDAGPDADW